MFLHFKFERKIKRIPFKTIKEIGSPTDFKHHPIVGMDEAPKAEMNVSSMNDLMMDGQSNTQSAEWLNIKQQITHVPNEIHSSSSSASSTKPISTSTQQPTTIEPSTQQSMKGLTEPLSRTSSQRSKYSDWTLSTGSITSASDSGTKNKPSAFLYRSKKTPKSDLTSNEISELWRQNYGTAGGGGFDSDNTGGVNQTNDKWLQSYNDSSSSHKKEIDLWIRNYGSTGGTDSEFDRSSGGSNINIDLLTGNNNNNNIAPTSITPPTTPTPTPTPTPASTPPMTPTDHISILARDTQTMDQIQNLDKLL